MTSTSCRRLLVIACAAGLGAAAPMTAQTPLHVVAGTVVSDDRPAQPIRRATVSLISPELRVPLSAITDDTGRFTIGGVPAGHYMVVGSKPAYVGAFYGSKHPGRGPGVPVAVGAGAPVANLRLTLIRGSVIAGTLRLPSGEPAHNMPIAVVAIETVNGVRRLRLAGGRTTTDDRGEYRVFGLPPGEYLVQAQPSGLLTGALTAASDAPQTTSAEVSWARQSSARAGNVAPTAPPAPQRGRTMNYATVYFPGTPDATLATSIHVGAAEERRGIDFALALVTTTAISGTTVAEDGAPLANVTLQLVTEDAGLNAGQLLTRRPAVASGADGSFRIPAVPPGRYRLIGRASSAGAAPAGADVAPGVRWADEPLVVTGPDVASVTLTMRPGMTVAGRLDFKTSAIAPPSPDDLARARVTVTPAAVTGGAAEALVSGAASATTAVGRDGTFSVSGLPPNRYRVNVSMPGMVTTPAASGRWSLAAITLRGANVLDGTLELRPGDDVKDLVVMLSDRMTELRGSLTDRAGHPAAGFPIVVFSASRADWFAGSRRVTTARPSTDGTFRLVGLPPGRYFLSAVVAVDAADLEDAAFLEGLTAGALTVTLTEGRATVQNIRLAGG